MSAHKRKKGYKIRRRTDYPLKNRWEGDTSRIRFDPKHKIGLAPAGRLDIDSVGLLVLTQDGRIAKQLIGENSGSEKEYFGARARQIGRKRTCLTKSRIEFGR